MSKERRAPSYRGIENVVPPNRVVRWVWERVGDWYLKDVEIEGEENLHEARQMARNKKTGINFVGPHLSNADWFVFKKALKKSGVRDVDGGFVPMLGKRLYSHPVTRFGVYAAPHAKIWPPTEEPKNKQEEKAMRAMNSAALRAHHKILEAGMDILIFPQGGREKHEITRIPEPQVAGFLDQGVVMPFGMLADKILPKGKWVPNKDKGWISWGKPLLGSDIRTMFAHLPKNDRRQAHGIYVMTLVADLMPEDYRGEYTQRVEDLKKQGGIVLRQGEPAAI